MLEIFKTAGASDDEIEVISKVISKRGIPQNLENSLVKKMPFQEIWMMRSKLY